MSIHKESDQEKEKFDELLKLFLVIYKDLKSTDHLNESPLPDFQNLITSIELFAVSKDLAAIVDKEANSIFFFRSESMLSA